MLEAFRSVVPPAGRRGRHAELPARSPSSGHDRSARLFEVTAAAGDLPCPWCKTPSSEADPRCPGCGRRFG